MRRELIVASGNTHAVALDALTRMLLAGPHTRDGQALNFGGLRAVRHEHDPREIACKAIAYQAAQAARGVNLCTWQAVNAVM